MASNHVTRRRVLQGAVALATAGTAPRLTAFARWGQNGRPASGATSRALALARLLNQTQFRDLPPKAVEYAKVIIASTLASAAPGASIESARIIRDLAKEHGGKPEATVWFDGVKLPVNDAAHVNAVLSDAFASDDSDMRNTAHIGTCVTSAGMAIAERAGSTGQDLLTAMIAGYEAAGRIGDARRGGRPGVHASQTVAFAGAVTAGRLLKLTDEQMAHAIGITAVTMGGLSIGTNSWAREYMGGNAAFCARQRRAGRRTRVYGQRGHPRGAGRLPDGVRRRRRTGQPDPDARLRQGVGHHQVPGDQALAGRPPVFVARRSRHDGRAAGERAGR